MKKVFLTLVSLFLLGSFVLANNVQVSYVSISNKNAANNTFELNFTVTWDNSWADDINHDAVWVFAKIKNGSNKWVHVLFNINEANHTLGNPEAVIEVGETSGNGVGAFIYRGVNGVGTFTTTATILAGYTDEWFDSNPIFVQVLAIEMVQIPEGEFMVGSGGSELNHFYTYGSNDPYTISSEDEITVGTTAGNLYYNADNIYAGDQTGPIPAAYPKGYAEFYIMKYEITQEQYVTFLNLLDALQASNRYSTSSTGYRYGITGSWPNFTTTNPYVACNWISWADGIAYADWAGLRPMSELEFEKACRGGVTPIPNEYAWGSTSITQCTGITNPGAENETPTNVDANCNFGYHPNVQGPVRSGCFANGTSTQIKAGASYYGVMELSGNLWERPVTIGNPTGRSFTGAHGDGTLSGSDANVTGWPGVNAIGGGFRGGFWSNSADYCRSSDRSYAASTNTGRHYNSGFRCVRGM